MKKQELKAAFKKHLKTVAAYKMESGNDTFQRIMNAFMSNATSTGDTKRKYWMKYDKNKYRDYVRALHLNMTYSRVNNLDYGKHSWLNCNDVN